MEFKKYTEEEFEKWCEDHMIEDNFGLWEFIKEQNVALKTVTDEHGDESILTIDVNLIEV